MAALSHSRKKKILRLRPIRVYICEMFRSAILITLLFACFGIVAGQNVLLDRCPAFSVTGPAGVPVPGETITYEADISGPMPKEFTYQWSVRGGVIVDGQGSTQIKVLLDKVPADYISALFEIRGLPNECPATASRSASICAPLVPILIDAFPTLLKTIEKERFRIAADAQKNNPNDQLYIIEYFRSGTSQFEIRERHKRLREFLVNEGLDEAAIIIVTTESKKPLTKIYRIPPGVEVPQFEEFEQVERDLSKLNCPSVSVLGPAGTSRPGETINFTINVELGDPEKFSYSWDVSGGEILGGEDTPSIRVLIGRTDADTTIKATVKVIGLAAQCTNTAEGEAVVQGGGDPPLIDEFGVLSDLDLRQRLKQVATELKRWPNYHLNIISYTKPTERKIAGTRRQRRIRRILIENGVPSDNITTVDGGSLSSKVNTKFYAVPPKN